MLIHVMVAMVDTSVYLMTHPFLMLNLFPHFSPVHTRAHPLSRYAGLSLFLSPCTSLITGVRAYFR